MCHEVGPLIAQAPSHCALQVSPTNNPAFINCYDNGPGWTRPWATPPREIETVGTADSSISETLWNRSAHFKKCLLRRIALSTRRSKPERRTWPNAIHAGDGASLRPAKPARPEGRDRCRRALSA